MAGPRDLDASNSKPAPYHALLRLGDRTGYSLRYGVRYVLYGPCSQDITNKPKPPTIMANTSAVPDLATVVQHITNAQPTNINALAHMLRSFDKDEQRDAILGGLLPGAQDPLAILNPRTNTLGYLYIL
jgi:hypothetical protein